jgi:hypothetical protein
VGGLPGTPTAFRGAAASVNGGTEDRDDPTRASFHRDPSTLKGYTKGEHVLRFEAITHNTWQLGRGRVLDKFPDRDYETLRRHAKPVHTPRNHQHQRSRGGIGSTCRSVTRKRPGPITKPSAGGGVRIGTADGGSAESRLITAPS